MKFVRCSSNGNGLAEPRLQSSWAWLTVTCSSASIGTRPSRFSITINEDDRTNTFFGCIICHFVSFYPIKWTGKCQYGGGGCPAHWTALGVSVAAIYAAKINNCDSGIADGRLQCSSRCHVTLAPVKNHPAMRPFVKIIWPPVILYTHRRK